MFEVRYGDYANYKVVKTDDLERAYSIYETAKRFAVKHGLTWVIALWEEFESKKYWLVQSDTINPTNIIH